MAKKTAKKTAKKVEVEVIKPLPKLAEPNIIDTLEAVAKYFKTNKTAWHDVKRALTQKIGGASINLADACGSRLK